jgi:type II secretory pathway pseudopilin PulG
MRRASLRSSSGFTFIGALVMVVILGIMATRAVISWKTAVRREKETELVFRGMQYMDALRRWYWPNGIPKQGQAATATPAGQNQQPVVPGTQVVYPANLPVGVPGPKELKDLVTGPGSSIQKKPCIRKLYLDPITGKEFEVHKAVDGRIDGVMSTSEEKPIKQGNFPFDLDPSDFEGKGSYKDWQFICTHWPKPLSNTGGKVEGGKTVEEMNKESSGQTSTQTRPK